MIKLKHNDKPTVRETTANFEHRNGNDEISSTEIRVQFYSYTTARLKELRSSVKAKLDAGETLWHSDSLADQLHGLPDLVDENEKPIFIPHGGNEKKRVAAVEFLDSLDIKNIDAIRAAIDNALAPKAPPEK